MYVTQGAAKVTREDIERVFSLYDRVSEPPWFVYRQLGQVCQGNIHRVSSLATDVLDIANNIFLC